MTFGLDIFLKFNGFFFADMFALFYLFLPDILELVFPTFPVALVHLKHIEIFTQNIERLLLMHKRRDKEHGGHIRLAARPCCNRSWVRFPVVTSLFRLLINWAHRRPQGCQLNYCHDLSTLKDGYFSLIKSSIVVFKSSTQWTFTLNYTPLRFRE